MLLLILLRAIYIPRGFREWNVRSKYQKRLENKIETAVISHIANDFGVSEERRTDF